MQEESRTAAQHLMKSIRPILLQRKKCEHKETLKLKEKVELVVWIPLASTQRRVYEKYLLKRTVRDAMERKNLAVDVINDLKTISRHPFLMEASEVLRKINAAKKGEGERGPGTSFDMSDIGDALDCIGSNSSSSKNYKSRTDGQDRTISSSNSDYNIGRSKDSRFNQPKRAYHPTQTHSSTQGYDGSRTSNSSNSSSNYDSDGDNGGEGVRYIGDRKLSANADVFEIAGRRPDVEELLQVWCGVIMDCHLLTFLFSYHHHYNYRFEYFIFTALSQKLTM